MKNKKKALIVISVIILLGSWLFFGCRVPDKNVPIVQDNIHNRMDYEVVVIDSCEYISFSIGSQSGLLTHKGNCKYCLQRSQKQ